MNSEQMKYVFECVAKDVFRTYDVNDVSVNNNGFVNKLKLLSELYQEYSWEKKQEEANGTQQ